MRQHYAANACDRLFSFDCVDKFNSYLNLQFHNVDGFIDESKVVLLKVKLN